MHIKSTVCTECKVRKENTLCAQCAQCARSAHSVPCAHLVTKSVNCAQCAQNFKKKYYVHTYAFRWTRYRKPSLPVLEVCTGWEMGQLHSHDPWAGGGTFGWESWSMLQHTFRRLTLCQQLRSTRSIIYIFSPAFLSFSPQTSFFRQTPFLFFASLNILFSDRAGAYRLLDFDGQSRDSAP
jgi:hypothetical protein